MTTKVIKVRISWKEAEAMLREEEPTGFEYRHFRNRKTLWSRLLVSIKKTFPEGLEFMRQESKAWELQKHFFSDGGQTDQEMAIQAQIDELYKEKGDIQVRRSDAQIAILQAEFDKAGITYFQPGIGNSFRRKFIPLVPDSPRNKEVTTKCQTQRNK